MDIETIQKYHRHRFPYLLIDCVDEIEPGKCVKGYKNFSENEWLFHCQTYTNQSVPFTMLMEILTEMFLMPILAIEGNERKLTNLISADNARVYKSVYPGDRLDIEAQVESWSRGIASGTASGYIDGYLVCTAQMKFVIPDILEQFKPSH